jgi:hypothetical protein
MSSPTGSSGLSAQRAAEDAATQADTYHAPAVSERTTFAKGTEKQNAYASDLRDEFIAYEAAQRRHEIREIAQREHSQTVTGVSHSLQIEDLRASIARREARIARAARSTNPHFWIKNGRYFGTIENKFDAKDVAGLAPR